MKAVSTVSEPHNGRNAHERAIPHNASAGWNFALLALLLSHHRTKPMLLEFLLLFLCLVALYCMHFGLQSLWSWVRSPAGIISSLPASSPRASGRLHHLRVARRTYAQKMFQKAVDAHQRVSESAAAGLAPTSPSSRNVSPERNGVFHNTSASALNSANISLKRTAAGRHKASPSANPHFQPHRPMLGSQQNPVDVDAGKGNRSQTSLQDNVFICEDDFDSDVDLDTEDLSSKPSVSYPKLSSSPPLKPATGPSSLATFPRASLHTHSNNSSHTSRSPQLKDSEEPYPWSSSPIGNRESLVSRNEARAATQSQLRPPPEREPAAPPPKRRTLPWLKPGSEEQTSETPRRDLSTSRLEQPQVPHPSPSSAYPWNVTHSAIKEQQKQLKKLNQPKKMEAEAHLEDDPSFAAATTTTRAKAEKVIKMVLSNEQNHILNLVLNKQESVFFTGSAGTGKSVLLREIISVLKRKYSRESDRVAVTASTGLAACNIGGVTLHSFAGIGLGKDTAQEMVKKIKRNQKHKHRWLRTKVLVIDEVSMVDGALFDKLEEVARSLRSNGRPFGGIQLVITGDFFQLPPVPDKGSSAKFCFEADSWNGVMNHTIGLHQVFRQKDPEFANMLNEMRRGDLSDKTVSTFRGLTRALDSGPSMALTELFSTRHEVEGANRQRMDKLHGNTEVFLARDGGSLQEEHRTRLLENCMAPREIALKKGAQVMLIKNIDEMLVNGSLGKVLGFMNEQQFDSWHAGGNLGRGSFAFDGEAANSYEERKQKLTSMIGTTQQSWPLVRFQMADGTTRDLLCQRESWKVEQPNGEVLASRSQIPLILAWALSIHKAQGQTLERVKVNLSKVFEKGQAYVALSRATSLEGLQVLGFDPKKVLAHPRVRDFYNALTKLEAK